MAALLVREGSEAESTQRMTNTNNKTTTSASTCQAPCKVNELQSAIPSSQQPYEAGIIFIPILWLENWSIFLTRPYSDVAQDLNLAPSQYILSSHWLPNPLQFGGFWRISKFLPSLWDGKACMSCSTWPLLHGTLWTTLCPPSSLTLISVSMGLSWICPRVLSPPEWVFLPPISTLLTLPECSA